MNRILGITALLALTVLLLAVTPFTNAVSRRYEAEADWRSLNATRDPASTQKLFQTFDKVLAVDHRRRGERNGLRRSDLIDHGGQLLSHIHRT